jgi:nitrile hydratase beta subunit
MNGIHDMGGMQDMGPIQIEKNEPVFHANWERRIFALFNAVDFQWPALRFQIESIPPADYLRMSYYERWAAALGPLVTQAGMVTQTEIDIGRAEGPANKKWHVLSAAEVAMWNVPEAHASANPTAAARFHAGQRVRARNINPPSHTRLPRYARGKVGTIERDAGIEAVQDTDVLGPKHQHVYSVRFSARELWGERANRLDSVCVAIWEGYLEAV